MAMGVRRLDHHWVFARGTTHVCATKCVAARAAAGACRKRGRAASYQSQARAPSHAGGAAAAAAARCVYHGLLRHYSCSASLAVRLCSRCEATQFCNARSRNSEVYFNLLLRRGVSAPLFPSGEFTAGAARGK